MREDGGGAGRESGAASVLALAAVTVLVSAAMPVALVTSVLVHHRHAVRAADLAALAGAQRSLHDAGAACSAAARVAAENGGRLDGCTLVDGSVVVTVDVRTRVALVPDVEATARAGWGGLP